MKMKRGVCHDRVVWRLIINNLFLFQGFGDDSHGARVPSEVALQGCRGGAGARHNRHWGPIPPAPPTPASHPHPTAPHTPA